MGLLLIAPMGIASWFLMTVGLHYQQITLFATIFGINVALGWQILVFHFLANEKVNK